MRTARMALGESAESLVCEHLAGSGYQIVARNVRVGRLEIDIIARRGRLVVFCEVRARTSDRWVTPAQTVDAGKVRRIRQAAAIWLKSSKTNSSEVRFDVASVVYSNGEPTLDYFERAF